MRTTKIHQFVVDHIAEKAKVIRAKYGPTVDYPVLINILEDRKCVRCPVSIEFDSSQIDSGLFAVTQEIVAEQDDEYCAPAGYIITLHEHFKNRFDILVPLILYQLTVVNYGDIATYEDAEIFASGILGIEQDDFYELICRLTDEIDTDQKNGSL